MTVGSCRPPGWSFGAESWGQWGSPPPPTEDGAPGLSTRETNNESGSDSLWLPGVRGEAARSWEWAKGTWSGLRVARSSGAAPATGAPAAGSQEGAPDVPAPDGLLPASSAASRPLAAEAGHAAHSLSPLPPESRHLHGAPAREVESPGETNVSWGRAEESDRFHRRHLFQGLQRQGKT